MSWWDEAACRENPSLFEIPTTPRSRRSQAAIDKAEQAIAICNKCPVLEHCRADAKRAGYFGFIAGGLLPEEQGPLDWLGGWTRSNKRDERLAQIEHGTRRGYQAHRSLMEIPCDECRAAQTEYSRNRRRRLGTW